MHISWYRSFTGRLFASQALSQTRKNVSYPLVEIEPANLRLNLTQVWVATDILLPIIL